MFIVEGKKERKTLLTAFLFSIFFNGKRHYKEGRGGHDFALPLECGRFFLLPDPLPTFVHTNTLPLM
jgi:hypothetical protein